MGIYAVTGGSSGIGAKTVELLKQNGHEVLNIDLRGGDITADLSKQEGREHVISELHRLCPDGLDGLICNAGVSGACGNLKLIVSLNFFGTVVLIKGAYDLLTISMFFRNKFLFRQYAVMESHIISDTQAEFIASFGGYCVMALVNLQQITKDGQIRRLTVRPH